VAQPRSRGLEEVGGDGAKQVPCGGDFVDEVV